MGVQPVSKPNDDGGGIDATEGSVIDRSAVSDLDLALVYRGLERADHLDDSGRLRPRYQLQVTREGERSTITFPFWGSIHDAETGDVDQDAREVLETVARDALTWYNHGGPDPLPLEVTLGTVRDELRPIMDNIAEVWGIEDPGEALETTLNVMETVKSFNRLGIKEDELNYLVRTLEE